MAKNRYIRILGEVQEFLGEAPELEESFQKIEDALFALEEPVVAPVPGGEFPIPSEIEGQESAFALFSDGACRGNPGPGSWGCMCQDFKGDVLFEQFAMEERTTNNRMELTGALEAIKELSYRLFERYETPQQCDVYVYTDSKYLVDGMNSWVEGWKRRGWKKSDKKEPENLDLWQQLDGCREKFSKLHFCWVKGHAGHPQNERCDQLCNQVLDDNGY